MKTAIKWLPILVTVLVFAFLYNQFSQGTLKNFLFPDNPCRKPIEYKLGQIDPRFGTSQAQILKALLTAETAWENATNQNLFSYNPDAAIKVNLIYDERQERTNALKKLQGNLGEVEDLQKGLAVEYDSLSVSYNKKLETYESNLAEYNKDLKEYNQEVEKWNRKGGAPEEEYDRLVKKGKELEKNRATLEKQRIELNALADKVGALAKKEQKAVDEYNRSAQTYQDRHGGGKEFEQGTYDGENINVYQFFDTKDLSLTLAHEMGHSLGIGHLDNPSDVMYYLMEKQSLDPLVITGDDKNAVAGICRTKR